MHKWFGLSFSVFSFLLSLLLLLLLLLQTCTEVMMYFVHDSEFLFPCCFRYFFSFLSVVWTVPHRGRWALLEGFRVSDGLSLHLILNQKVCFTLISNTGRYAMKASWFFLMMKDFCLFYIQFLFKKKKMQRHISSLCICKGHLKFFHFVCSGCAWGNWTCRVGEERVDSLFFSCKKHTHIQILGKPETIVVVNNF